MVEFPIVKGCPGARSVRKAPDPLPADIHDLVNADVCIMQLLCREYFHIKIKLELYLIVDKKQYRVI